MMAAGHRGQHRAGKHTSTGKAAAKAQPRLPKAPKPKPAPKAGHGSTPNESFGCGVVALLMLAGPLAAIAAGVGFAARTVLG